MLQDFKTLFWPEEPLRRPMQFMLQALPSARPCCSVQTALILQQKSFAARASGNY